MRVRKYARYGKTINRKGNLLYRPSVIFFSIPENTKTFKDSIQTDQVRSKQRKHVLCTQARKERAQHKTLKLKFSILKKRVKELIARNIIIKVMSSLSWLLFTCNFPGQRTSVFDFIYLKIPLSSFANTLYMLKNIICCTQKHHFIYIKLYIYILYIKIQI